MKLRFKTLTERYQEATYPEESIQSLQYLESRAGSLNDLLEGYRHLQPNGLLFSPQNIGIIKELHMLMEYVESALQDLKDQQERSLFRLRETPIWDDDSHF